MIPDRPIRVLVIDNSCTVRSTFERVLSSYDDLTVSGTAATAHEARELIIQHRPHVIVLNIALPRVSGRTFLQKLMRHYPVPIIICADSTGPLANQVVEALALGAVDVVSKPALADRATLESIAAQLAGRIQKAAALCPIPPEIPASASSAPPTFGDAGLVSGRYLVAIGASTGGPDALAKLVANAPRDFPPAAIVQHMPEGFTKALADRLDRGSRLRVCEAVDGQPFEVGTVLVAQAGVQAEVRPAGDGWVLRYGSTRPYNLHCPSVDILFSSAARVAGKRSVGVLLTGMGDDGARGLLAMREAGALTLGQSRESCVVYGMPKVAAKLDAVCRTGAPSDMPNLIRTTLAHSQARSSRNRPVAT